MPQKTETVRDRAEYTRRKKNRRGATRKEMAEDAAQPHRRIKGEIKFNDPGYYEAKKAQDEWEAKKEREKREEAARKGAITRVKNDAKRAREAEFLRKVEKMDNIIRRLQKQQAQAPAREQTRIEKKIRKMEHKKSHMKLKFDDAQRIHSYRNRKNREKDEKTTAKYVVSDWRWAQNPGRYDYPGVDTQNPNYNRFSEAENARDHKIESGYDRIHLGRELLQAYSKKNLKHIQQASIPEITHRINQQKSSISLTIATLEMLIKTENDPARKARAHKIIARLEKTSKALTQKIPRIEEMEKKEIDKKKREKKSAEARQAKNLKQASKDLARFNKKSDRIHAQNMKLRKRLAEIENAIATDKAAAERLRKEGSHTRLGRVERAIAHFEKRKHEIEAKIKEGIT